MFNVNLGYIETVISDVRIKAVKSFISSGNTDSVLFVNHTDGNTYDYRECELEVARNNAEYYFISLDTDSISYSKTTYEYCKDSYPDIEMESECVKVRADLLINVLFHIKVHIEEIKSMHGTVRRRNVMSLYNLNDEQYENLQRHFQNPEEVP